MQNNIEEVMLTHWNYPAEVLKPKFSLKAELSVWSWLIDGAVDVKTVKCCRILQIIFCSMISGPIKIYQT